LNDAERALYTSRAKSSRIGTKLKIAGVLAGSLFAAGAYGGLRASAVGTSYGAKILCSAVFVANRDSALAIAQDLALFSFVQTEVDREAKAVHASLRGLTPRTAIYREGLGCALTTGTTVEALRAAPSPPPPKDTAALRWPTGDTAATSSVATVDGDKLLAAIDVAFEETDTDRPKWTRAIVIVHRGKIIGERYAPGFGDDTPQLGWSMAKSITAAMIGGLVHEGRMSISESNLLPQWADDGRRDITIDHLLRMSSGLAFDESYHPFGDATRMLFEQSDTAAYAMSNALDAPADTRWSYSSGTTNILTKIIRDRVADDAAYYALPRRLLFDRLGMRTAVIEPDPAGTFVGSSFVYASARDWARFGLLFLQDGVWEGVRLLPEGWARYVSTPTPTDPEAHYGAHFWLNAEREDGGRRFERVPVDVYWADGYEGQAVVIVPSRELVVVRLGSTQRGGWGAESFIADVVDAVDSAK